MKHLRNTVITFLFLLLCVCTADVSSQVRYKVAKSFDLRVTSNVTNATATLANATGLVTTTNLTAGKTYRITGNIYVVDSVAAEGIKIALDAGTATATNIRAEMIITDSALKTAAQVSALATATTAATVTGDSIIQIVGTITVNAAGTFGIRFAQNSHTSGTATLYQGSVLHLVEVQ